MVRPSMKVLLAKTAVVLGSAGMVAIRLPYRRRGFAVKIASSRKGPLERFLLFIAGIGFFLPLIWVLSPLLAFADFPVRVELVALGIALMGLGLWFLHRSHLDLGDHWSISLEMRENHRLICEGLYRRVRHPMYLAFFVFGLGQWLCVPNWLAGPAYVVGFALLFAFRLKHEEQMMIDTFGAEYEAYRARTHRLI